MRYELLIALRYLRSRRKSVFISITTFFTAIGVTLGVAALTITLAVMNGFEANLRTRVLSLSPQVQIVKVGGMSDYKAEAAKARAVPGVAGADPFILGQAMLTSPDAARGVIARGIEPTNAAVNAEIDRYIIAGHLATLVSPVPSAGRNFGFIAIGKALADKLHVGLGDGIRIISPIVSPSGEEVTATSEPLEIGAIFDSGVQFIDDNLIFMDLGDAQSFFGRQGLADGIEVRLKNLDQTQQVTTRIRKLFPFPRYRVQNWMEIDQAATAGFAMLKTVYSMVLMLLIAVAAFNLIAMLIMVVMEKRKDIAILMTMGATRRGVRLIFVLKGMIVGLIGSAGGLVLGAVGCLVLSHFHFIHLPRDIYGMSTLPVAPSVAAFAWVALAALGLCLVAALYPARQASRQLPVEIIRWD